MRIDVSGKFVGQLKRRGSDETVSLAIEVLSVVSPPDLPANESMTPTQIANDSSLVLGKIVLANIAGMAIPNKSIYLYHTGLPTNIASDAAIGGFASIGVIESAITIKTNGSGYAEVSLYKGMRIRISFEGSRLIKEIVVPEVDFNLFTQISSAPDFTSIIIPEYTNPVSSS